MAPKKRREHSESYEKKEKEKYPEIVSALLREIRKEKKRKEKEGLKKKKEKRKRARKREKRNKNKREERAERDELIVKLLFETGCRSNEIVNLKPSDVDFQKNLVKIKVLKEDNKQKKNKKERKINITEQLSKQLKKFLETKEDKEERNKIKERERTKRKEETYIFSPNKNSRLRTRSIRKIFEKYSERLGTKIRSGDLRKAHINELIKTKPVKEIKKSLGIKRFEKKESLTEEEFERVKESAQKDRDKIILKILFETGCTLKEITNIKVADINFSKNSLKIRTNIKENKNKKIKKYEKRERKRTISKELSSQIKKFIEEKGLTKECFLLSTRESQKISDKRIFQIIKSCAKRARLKGVNPQILRYSHIAHTLRRGKPVKELSEEMGIRHLNRIPLYGALGLCERYEKYVAGGEEKKRGEKA